MNDQCPLSDGELDALDTFALHCLAPRQRESVREYGRAVATAAVEAERQRREGEDFEDALEAHHRAELGLRPKLSKGHHYYVAHPLAQVEIRKDSAITEDRAALAPLGAQAVPISILELMDEVRGLAAQWAGDEVDLACAPSEDASARAQNSHDIFNAAVARLASMSTGTTSPAQIAEDRAALAEECKQIAHHLFDISPEAEDMVHLSMAIDRLAASHPQSAALAAHNQLLSNALDELIYLVHELECKDNSCGPAVDISDLERLAASPLSPSVVPEDLQLVPKKVSNAMIDAANNVPTGIAGSPPHWQWVWDALLSAARSQEPT